MTLAVAFSLTYDLTTPTVERSIFIAADSRITYPKGPPADDGAKVIVLDPIPAVLAFSGVVNLGEPSLALAAKLVRQEPSPTLERIRDLTLAAFQKFYRPGASLSGLLGAVSPDGTSDSIWKLAPHDSREMTVHPVSDSAMIGSEKAQAAYESTRQEHWASLASINPGGAPPVAVGIGHRHVIMFDKTVDEMNRGGSSTIGRPIQALLVTKDRYWSFGAGKYNEQDDEWEQIHPRDGEVRFRNREPELHQMRRKAPDLR